MRNICTLCTICILCTAEVASLIVGFSEQSLSFLCLWVLMFKSWKWKLEGWERKHYFHGVCALTDWASRSHKKRACYSQWGERRKYALHSICLSLSLPLRETAMPQPHDIPQTCLKGAALTGCCGEACHSKAGSQKLQIIVSHGENLSLSHSRSLSHPHLSGSLNWCLANLGQLKRLNSIFSLSLSSLPADHQ